MAASEPPTAINPYTILSLSPTATQDEVKAAYRRAALQHHPDKASAVDKDSAHTRFQEVALAYAILSDEHRRRRYDATGSTAESLYNEDDGNENGGFDWAEFYRAQYADVVTQATITSFATEYKGSDEERSHVLAAFVKHKGKIEKIYQEVMLSEMLDDEERYRGWIDEAITKGEVEDFPAYVGETAKQRDKRMEQARKRRESQAKEAEKAEAVATKKTDKKGKVENEGLQNLAALIQQNKAARAETFFNGLEAKYASKKGGSKRPAAAAAADDEPPEEAFARNRKKGKLEDDEPAAGGANSKRSKAKKT